MLDVLGAFCSARTGTATEPERRQVCPLQLAQLACIIWWHMSRTTVVSRWSRPLSLGWHYQDQLVLG